MERTFVVHINMYTQSMLICWLLLLLSSHNYYCSNLCVTGKAFHVNVAECSAAMQNHYNVFWANKIENTCSRSTHTYTVKPQFKYCVFISRCLWLSVEHVYRCILMLTPCCQQRPPGRQRNNWAGKKRVEEQKSKGREWVKSFSIMPSSEDNWCCVIVIFAFVQTFDVADVALNIRCNSTMFVFFLSLLIKH